MTENKYIELINSQEAEIKRLTKILSERNVDLPDDELTAFYIAMRRMTGEVSFNRMFHRFLIRAKREKKIYVVDIALNTGVGASTISLFRRGKVGLTVGSMQKVINYVLSK